jgi:antitoxin component of MazEF toxin-antitoxin module
MIKKLARHGNSMALVIERGVLDLLNIQEDTPLNITTDGNVLIVAPVHNSKRRKLFEAGLAEGNAKYGRMLKRLAD